MRACARAAHLARMQRERAFARPGVRLKCAKESAENGDEAQVRERERRERRRGASARKRAQRTATRRKCAKESAEHGDGALVREREKANIRGNKKTELE